MNFRILPCLYILVTVLLLANCVREVDFSRENADTGTLVVSGTFSDGPGPHRIYLSRPNDVKKKFFLPVTGAQVTLTDDGGNRYEYQEVIAPADSSRYYQLTQVQGIPGHVYSLEVRLPDGTLYRSRPQVMPERIPADSATVRGEWYTTINSNGTVVREPYAYAYVHTTCPANTAGRYLRWDAESVHIFNEIFKIYYPIPPPALQCFIPSQLSAQTLPLAKLSDFQPGAKITEQVGKRYINFAFELRVGICVYQRSIGREAYEYWQKIDQLIEPSGTILDAPPAQVLGNVENLTNPGQPALGFFEVAAIDTVRVFTRDDLLGDAFQINERPYCDYDWSKWPPVTHPECDKCLLLEGATLEKPYWW